MFGGEGFILRRTTGPGTVFLTFPGSLVIEELLPGQKLLVHAGHIGVQSPSIDFSIQGVQGFSNLLFGREGLFLASVTGPGKIWLQSMPIMNLAETIAAYLPSDKEGSASSGGAGNFIGGVIGGIDESEGAGSRGTRRDASSTDSPLFTPCTYRIRRCLRYSKSRKPHRGAHPRLRIPLLVFVNPYVC